MGELTPGAPVAVGYEAVPASGSGPGVLVLHAWWGLNDFFKGFCDRLAAEGFVVVAPDLWGGTVATTVEEAERLIGHESESMFQTVADALDHLAAHPAVRSEALGVVGFSMGAAWALTLASAREQLAAAVIFYGTYIVDFTTARAAFQGHFAPGDPWEPDEGVAQLEAAMGEAGREVQLHRYPGTGHWFFEADRPDAYDAAAAELAWERTVSFLRERLEA